MRKLFRLLVLFSAISIPFTFAGCSRGPEEAEEDEAMQGMDDMDSFENASDTGEDNGANP